MKNYFKKTRFFFIYFLISLSGILNASSIEYKVPTKWLALKPILLSRVEQSSLKMKISSERAHLFVKFLTALQQPTPRLMHLENILPRTTLELLMAVHERNLALKDAEEMAVYLQTLVEKFQFQNLSAFDENTSHIIGREWHEIDYSGEGMTWEKQRQKYLPYGILHFKSVESLSKFFPVESRLSYFKKTYRPQNPAALIPHF